MENQKSFLQRPEGKVGLVVGLLLLVAGALGLNAILPFVITLLTNTLHAALLAGALAFLIFLVSDKRIRTLASYGYKSIMRGLTGLFIEIDPIGILKGIVTDAKEKLEIIKKSISTLRGQISKLQSIIDKNEEIRIHSLQLAGQAQKNENNRNVFIFQSRQAGRKKATNIKLEVMLDTLKGLHARSLKVYEVMDLYTQDLEADIENKIIENQALLAGYNAITAAKSILDGGTDRKEILNMALEKLATDASEMVGEMDTFMEMSEGFMKSLDLENGLYEADALAQLEQLEKKSQKILLGKDDVAQQVRISTVQTPTDVFSDLLNTPAEPPSQRKLSG